jgi:hypothetical protein
MLRLAHPVESKKVVANTTHCDQCPDALYGLMTPLRFCKALAMRHMSKVFAYAKALIKDLPGLARRRTALDVAGNTPAVSSTSSILRLGVGGLQSQFVVHSLADGSKRGSVTFSDELVDCRSAWKMAIS